MARREQESVRELTDCRGTKSHTQRAGEVLEPNAQRLVAGLFVRDAHLTTVVGEDEFDSKY